jgi:hypothetical protein
MYWKKWGHSSNRITISERKLFANRKQKRQKREKIWKLKENYFKAHDLLVKFIPRSYSRNSHHGDYTHSSLSLCDTVYSGRYALIRQNTLQHVPEDRKLPFPQELCKKIYIILYTAEMIERYRNHRLNLQWKWYSDSIRITMLAAPIPACSSGENFTEL